MPMFLYFVDSVHFVFVLYALCATLLLLFFYIVGSKDPEG